jgi:transcriptional regulator with XRE-family HTH domain
VQNGQLRTHRQLRGWSQQDLVRELVGLGIELGERQLGVNCSLISRWEHGLTQPRAPYPKLLCRLFNATAEELGLTVPSPPPSEDLQRLGLNYTSSIPDTLDAVDKLGRADIKRRVFLKTVLFAVAASIGPSRDWLLATLEVAFFPNRKVTTDHVEAIRRTFGVFQELDVMRGGGHARKELASYLTSTVTPLLRSNDASTDSGRALYEAGAEQLYLVGWMAFDDGEHALAQRYLIQALRLSQEARSAELGAHVLAGLSDQATLTGHPDHGLQLARAGRAGLRHGHSPACCADLWALQARAEAALGDGKAAARSVLESQRAADAIHLPDEPEWARFIDAAYLNGEYGHAFRDLNRPEEAAVFAARSAAEAARQSRARRGSLAHATLARAALADHDLQAAAAEAASTVRLATTVRSSRSIDAVADLRQRLAPHQGSTPVADFFDLANTLLPN